MSRSEAGNSTSPQGTLHRPRALRSRIWRSPPGAVLLLMNTAHKENHLERSDAYTYRYFKVPELRLRGSNFSLMLRDRAGAIVDVISSYSANAGASGASAGFKQDEAYLREKPGTPGYEAGSVATQRISRRIGLRSEGTESHEPRHTRVSSEAPSYRREPPVVNISEVMFTTGVSGNLPQWIELYNPSKTEVVTLQGWRLQVELYDPSRQPTHQFVTLILQNALRILPKQTVLIVTKNGRNSQHFPEPRLYNLTEQNPEKVEQFGPKAEFLNSVGYAVVLRDEVGNPIDIAGNLDGDKDTHDVPGWRLPNCITAVGRTGPPSFGSMKMGCPLKARRKAVGSVGQRCGGKLSPTTGIQRISATQAGKKAVPYPSSSPVSVPSARSRAR